MGTWAAVPAPARPLELAWPLGAAPQQRGDAVADEFAHDECGVGALDAGDREDLPGDAVQVVGVGGDHVHQQVGLPADPVDLQDLGDAGERGGHLVETPLGDLGGDVGGERVAEDRGRDLALERVDDALLLKAGKPRLDSVTGQPGLVGERDRGRRRSQRGAAPTEDRLTGVRAGRAPLTGAGGTVRDSGLDLLAFVSAPCLLGRPGTGRQDAVLTSLRLAGFH